MLNLLNETFSSLVQPFSIKVLLLAIFLILLYRWSSTSTNSTLPSPPRLPIIGNLHQLSLHPHRSLQTLSQRYGPLMLLHFGSKPVLIVSSAECASEIMKTHDLAFADRPRTAFFEKITYDYKDVAAAPYGEYWRQVKSICVLNLLSARRVRSFRAVREEETKAMIDNIMKQSSSSFSTSPVLNLSEMFVSLTYDVVCRVALGRKYGDRGETGKLFKKLSVELAELMAAVNIGDHIPWLAWYTRLNGLDAKVDSLAKRLDQFLDTVIEEHKDDVNVKTEDQKDLVDVLLSVVKENDSGIPIDLVSLKAIIMDMFAAGTDTTFSILEWTMSELLRHPRVMKKLQKEVRDIVGNKRDVTEEDLVEMHYLKAVVKETLRLHPPFPLLLPRMSTKDVEIKGYKIKANTQVIVNGWHIGRHPDSYSNPEEYEPERFLNSTIDYKGNDFQLIPFGAGRRRCPGIQFAMALKEFALANVVHKFDWELPDGASGKDLDMTESTGGTIHRKYPLKVVAVPYC